MPCLCMKSAFEFIFYCLELDPIPGGVRMGFFNTWEGGLPTASHLVLALTSAGSGWCGAAALLASSRLLHPLSAGWARI